MIWSEWEKYEEEKRERLKIQENTCDFIYNDNVGIFIEPQEELRCQDQSFTNDDISECSRFEVDSEMGKTPSVCIICNKGFSSITEMKAHRLEFHKGEKIKVDLKKSLPTKIKGAAATGRSPARKKVVNSAPGSPEVMNQWLSGQTTSNKVGELLSQGKAGLPVRPASNPGPVSEASGELTLQAQASEPKIVTLYPPAGKGKPDLSTVETRWKDALLGKNPGPPLELDLDDGGRKSPEKSKGGEKDDEKKRRRENEEDSVEGEADLKAADVKDTPPEMKSQEPSLQNLVATNRNLDAALAEVADSMDLDLGDWSQGNNIESGPLVETNRIDFTSFNETDQAAWEAEQSQGTNNVPLSPLNDMDDLYQKIETANASNKELTEKLKDVICEKEQLYNIVTELEDKLAVSQNVLAKAKNDMVMLTGKHKTQIEAAEQAVQTEKQKDEAEVLRLRCEAKQAEAKIRRSQNDIKTILRQNSDAKLEISKLQGEIKAERVKVSESAKTISRLEQFMRNAQEDRVHKEQQISGLEHQVKNLRKKLPCNLVNCEGGCEREHHCNEKVEEIPRTQSAPPTIENLAAQANITVEQMRDIVNLARATPGTDANLGGRARKPGSRKPRPGYRVERCRFFFNPELRVCPYGDECWNSHATVNLVSAQEEARAKRQGEKLRTYSESRVPRAPKFTPAYHPDHPEFGSKSQQAGNEKGQMSGATSVQNERPRHYSESVTSEEAARLRVQDSIAQRRNDRTHLQATQDMEAEYTQLLREAEAAISMTIGAANLNPGTGRDMA